MPSVVDVFIGMLLSDLSEELYGAFHYIEHVVIANIGFVITHKQFLDHFIVILVPVDKAVHGTSQKCFECVFWNADQHFYPPHVPLLHAPTSSFLLCTIKQVFAVVEHASLCVVPSV